LASLSSTTRMCKALAGASIGGRVEVRLGAGVVPLGGSGGFEYDVELISARWRGRMISNQNVVPTPSSLSKSSVPPISSIRLREMTSPSPVPPNRRVVVASAWEKG